MALLVNFRALHCLNSGKLPMCWSLWRSRWQFPAFGSLALTAEALLLPHRLIW